MSFTVPSTRFTVSFTVPHLIIHHQPLPRVVPISFHLPTLDPAVARRQHSSCHATKLLKISRLRKFFSLFTQKGGKIPPFYTILILYCPAQRMKNGASTDMRRTCEDETAEEQVLQFHLTFYTKRPQICIFICTIQIFFVTLHANYSRAKARTHIWTYYLRIFFWPFRCRFSAHCWSRY